MGGRVPWSNGSEKMWFQDKWCASCANDHGAHGSSLDYEPPLCELLAEHDLFAGTDEWSWPVEVWVEIRGHEGKNPALRMVCLKYEPCEVGDCDGDPAPEGTRAELFAAAEAGLRGTV